MTRPRRAVAARVGISALLVATAVRPWGAGALAWIAFVPLLGALGRVRTPRAGAACVVVVALAPAVVAYEALAPLSPVGSALVGTLAAALLAPAGALAVAARLRWGRAALAWALPLGWCALEALPAQPWLWGRWTAPLLRLGYSQFGLPTAHLARWGGVGLVAAVVLGANALLWLAVGAAGRAPALRRGALAGLAVLAGGTVTAAAPRAVVHAAARAVRSERAQAAADSGPGRTGISTVRVRLVQPDHPDAAFAAARALPSVRSAILERLVEASRGTPGGHADLVLWPEGAVPGPLPERSDAPERSALAERLDALPPVLFGAGARRGTGVGNAVFLADDGLTRVYDKRRLVPVGPERGLEPGRSGAVVPVAGLRLAPLVCFEAAFPALAREAARAGATALAVLTNDAYARFLDTARLHLRMAAFRALETARPVLFVSNTGPSALIAADGRVTASTGRGARTLDVSLTPGVGRTAYVRFGAVADPVVLVLGLLATVAVGARGGAVRR